MSELGVGGFLLGQGVANLIWEKRHQLESKQFNILPLLLLPVQPNSVLMMSRDLSVQPLSTVWS